MAFMRILRFGALAAALMSPAASPAAATLFDFETEEERAMVEKGSQRGFTVSVTNAFATSGLAKASR